MGARYRPRFFDQVGHQTTYASMGNKHLLNKKLIKSSKLMKFILIAQYRKLVVANLRMTLTELSRN